MGDTATLPRQYNEEFYGPGFLDWSSRIGDGGNSGRIKPDLVAAGVGIVAGRSDGNPESGGSYGCRFVAARETSLVLT